jgi:predicted secreted protein
MTAAKTRRLLSLAMLPAVAALATTGAAKAGDAAELEILGFSKDGGVFAFEEYGIQDGSGFPYANRYYIDTATDTFLKGTPIRLRIDDEEASLADARKQVRDKGEAVVKQAELAANPGFTAGFNPVTELSADPHRMVVNPRPVFPAIDKPLEFRLEILPFGEVEQCHGMSEASGFRLLRMDASDGGRTQVVHEDKTLPQSRNCPTGYSIGAIQTFSTENRLTHYAVLIAVEQVGFEGPAHRWMAVTGKF